MNSCSDFANFYNPTAELAIPTGTPIKEANTENETQPPTRETNTRICLKKFKALQVFYAFHSLILYVLFLPKISSIF